MHNRSYAHLKTQTPIVVTQTNRNMANKPHLTISGVCIFSKSMHRKIRSKGYTFPILVHWFRLFSLCDTVNITLNALIFKPIYSISTLKCKNHNNSRQFLSKPPLLFFNGGLRISKIWKNKQIIRTNLPLERYGSDHSALCMDNKKDIFAVLC